MSLSFFGKKIAPGLLLLACPALALANIGDTLPELRARYGSAKDMGGQMLFQVQIVDGKLVRLPPSADQREGYSVTVYFDGDHSAMEVFTRNTSDPAKAEMSRDDIDKILAAESDGQSWNPVQVSTGKQTWLRLDNKLIARFSPNSSGGVDGASVLVIMENSK